MGRWAGGPVSFNKIKLTCRSESVKKKVTGNRCGGDQHVISCQARLPLDKFDWPTASKLGIYVRMLTFKLPI
ncbi:hypothetical protein D3OALGA1CA_4380 [Olavius algarvensis associated proteobacterium Delta 3]|nr:hypothetical protein D3OALGA1CA_4380 [Olavius algarvensis associated proteobacterium Delta 3]